MKQQRTLIVLVVAVATAAIAAYAVFLAIQNRPVREVEVASVPVVVASREIPVGTPLNRDDLRVVSWPASSQVAGAYADPKDVIGRGVIETIVESEPVTSRKIATPEGGAGLGPVIPRGMRAISVRVNEVISVAHYTVPGTRVDVLVSAKDDGTGRSEPTARTVVTNVEVLAAGKRTDQEEARQGATPPAVTVITLAVTPEDAEKVLLASTEGEIGLSLRNPLDVEPTNTAGIRMAALMRGSVPAAPIVRRTAPRRAAAPDPLPPIVVPPPAPYTVETIRAGKATDEVVD